MISNISKSWTLWSLKCINSRRGLIAASIAVSAGLMIRNVSAKTVVAGTVVGKQGWLYLVWDDPRHVNFDQITRVTDLIGNAVAIMRAAQINVVIAFTPAKSRVYRSFLPDDFRFTPESDRRYVIALDHLRKSGAIVPDLATAFADMLKVDPDTKLFFKSDTHWTALGAELAAKTIAREINAQLKLPKSSLPGSNIGPAISKLHLRSDLSLPLSRQQYPDELFEVHEVVQNTKDFVVSDNVQADIVVIGSSMMQPKYNFSPMLSNTLGRPVDLLWRNHLTGPYKTLLAYLASASFKSRRPNVIIWNFLEVDMELMPDLKSVFFDNAMPPNEFLAGVAAAVKVNVSPR